METERDPAGGVVWGGQWGRELIDSKVWWHMYEDAMLKPSILYAK